jgi:hypothetical protein
MAGLIAIADEKERRFLALLYHPRRPCANPCPGVMMNKQQATGIRVR